MTARVSGLDPALRREMVALIDELRREKGLTVLMTTHTPDDVEDRADLLLTVRDGRYRSVVHRPGLPPINAYMPDRRPRPSADDLNRLRLYQRSY